MRRKNFIRLISALLVIVLGNIVSGIFSIPFLPLLLTLVVVPIAVYQVSASGIHIFSKGVFGVVLFISNDIFLRILFFVPDRYIGEGIFYLLLTEVPTFIISAIIFLITVRSEFAQKKWTATGSFFFFCLTIVFYLYFTGYKQIFPLGKEELKSMASSQRKGILISELTFNNPLIVIRMDTIHLKNAWMEKDLKVEPGRLISTINESGKYRIVVRFDYRINDWGYSNKFVFYPDGDRGRGGFLFPTSVFSFVTDSLSNDYQVTIVRLKKDSVSFSLSRKKE